LWCSEGRHLYRPESRGESFRPERHLGARKRASGSAMFRVANGTLGPSFLFGVRWWKAANLRRGYPAFMWDPALVGYTAGAHPKRGFSLAFFGTCVEERRGLSKGKAQEWACYAWYGLQAMGKTLERERKLRRGSAASIGRNSPNRRNGFTAGARP
jgi:hypothetical protein